MQEPTIAISATFSAEMVAESLRFWTQELKIPSRIEFAPYHQVFQQLLNPASLLTQNQGVNVVLVRFEDWAGSTNIEQSQKKWEARALGEIERNVHDLIRALRSSKARAHTPHVLCLCPASTVALADTNLRIFFERMEDFLVSELDGASGVYLVRPSELVAAYPVLTQDDSQADRLGHIPYTRAFFTSLGTMIARRIYCLQCSPRKVIALDCDETLWKGVCGEVGARGIEIDPPRRALQEFILAQHAAGMLICLCSRNNEEDVLQVFEQHPQMRLRLEHLISWRLNWRPKSENLKSLAEELHLGLDSFILIDDDPVTCAEVEANCPEVCAVVLPSEPDCFPRFLARVWAFDRPKLTTEDQKRTTFYRQNRARERMRHGSKSFTDFLASLNLKVQITEMMPHQVARVAQLTQRTNQFNLTNVRRSESEILMLSESEKRRCLVVKVSDRFGDYGLVGALICGAKGNALEIETFLLSCRALGRGVEHLMLTRLGEIARECGLSTVNLIFMRSGKNQPALDFLETVAARFKQTTGDGYIFRLPVEVVESLSYLPEIVALEPTGESARRQSVAASPMMKIESETGLRSRIAMELMTVDEIQHLIEQRQRRSRPQLQDFVTPRTPVEEGISRIWSEVLGIECVGIYDNFFALGGHSLLIIQVVSRIHDAFRVELPLPRFFAEPTVASLALAVTELQVAKLQPEEMDKFIEHLEQLSPDEVEMIMNRKRGGSRAAELVTSGARHEQAASRLEAASSPGDAAVYSAAAGEQNQFLDQISRHSGPPPGLQIPSVGVTTRDRPQALRRCLMSYIENCLHYGRRTEFAVMDDSASAETRQHTRQMLRTLQRRYGVSIVYAGREEKICFAQRLIGSDLPVDVVNFALFDVERCGYSYGANFNAVLLHTTGDLTFSVDDDTVCRVATKNPASNTALRFTSGCDPRDLWFFRDRETALQSATFVEKNVLAAHEQWLGQDLASMFSGSAEFECDFDLVDSCFRRRLESGNGKVLVTLNGLLGDSGWGSPFGYWARPTGCLFLDGESRERVVRSEMDYRSACTSREVLSVVQRTTISDGTVCVGTFLGLDNRLLLPPFMPVQRGQDVVFGLTVEKCFQNGYFGHLPWTLLHAPIEKRQFWPNEIFRSASGFDTAKLLIACINSFEMGFGDANERLRALGRYLIELGSLSLAAFEEFMRIEAWRTNSAFICLMEERLKACGEQPKFWADDCNKYLGLLRQALARKDYWVPLDLLAGRSFDEARQLAQRLILKFGQLLQWWPEMTEKARRLRAQGQSLAGVI